MTEQRYSDGTLAKWYYSQTDVISNGDNEYYLKSKKSIRNVDYSTLLGTNDLLDELNRLSDENEQLKARIEELEFKLRTIEAYDRTVKEEHSDTVYDFKKKLETW